MFKQQVPRWREFKKRQQKIPVWWGLQGMFLKDSLQEEIRFQQMLNYIRDTKKSYQW